jgi:hypothetical protein
MKKLPSLKLHIIGVTSNDYLQSDLLTIKTRGAVLKIKVLGRHGTQFQVERYEHEP